MKAFIFGVLYLSTVILLALNSEAALIYGTIYDFNLEPTSSAVVEVNSSPIQRFLSKDGKYSFVLDEGDYSINTRLKIAEITYSAEEQVLISDDGVYVIDLFLFPQIEDDDSLFEELGDNSVSDKKGINWQLIVIVLLACVLLLILYISYSRYVKRYKKREAEPKPLVRGADYSETIIKIMKKNGGRMTQKDIRKNIPYSEAKISLIISELEESGRVKRIKKGRGNIIILVK